MLSINTNLLSLIAQRNIKSATDILNQTINRMSTGFKVNGAKDDPANYAVITDMSTKISSYDIAEDNALMSLDMITSTCDTLDLLERNMDRLRSLQSQVLNDTLSQDSLDMINVECNSIIDEINRLYLESEYNGINMFLETTTSADGTAEILQEVSADELTTFKELNITSSSFSVYDKRNNLLQTYDVEGEDTIQDFFNTLEIHGITGKITTGRIELDSADDNYVAGALIDKLGITTFDKTFVDSTSQTSATPITYNTVLVSTTEHIIYTTTTTSTTQTNTIWETTTTSQTITETIYTTTTTSTTLTQTVDVDKTVGVDITSTAPITYTSIGASSTATESSTLASIGLEGDHSIGSVTFNDSTTIGTLVANLNSAGIETTFSNGVLIINGIMDETVGSSIDIKNITNFTEVSADTIITISDEEGLRKLATMVNAGQNTSGRTFKLTNDINLTQEFTPIGWYDSTNDIYRFYGTFDGCGHTIKGLKITATKDYSALFGLIKEATVKNLTIENAQVNGSGYKNIGILAGSVNNNSLVENCKVSGSVSASQTVAGLASFLGNGSVIQNCHVEATITASAGNTGGITASCSKGTIRNSTTNINIRTNDHHNGGIAGVTTASLIENCYSAGTITGSAKHGGMVGTDNRETIIKNCYSTMTLTENAAGAIIGHSMSTTEIINCYSTQNYGYGLWGHSSKPTITNSFTSADNITSASTFSSWVNEKNDFGESLWIIEDGNTPVLNTGYSILKNISMTNDVKNALGLSIINDNEFQSNILISTPKYTITATRSTTLAQLGITTKQTVTDCTGTFTYNTTNTLGDILDQILWFGHNGVDTSSDYNSLNIVNGKFTVDYKSTSNPYYIIDISNDLEKALHFNDNYTSVTTTTTVQTTGTIYNTTTSSTTNTSTIHITTTTSRTETETLWNTTTTSTTYTETIYTTSTELATGNTTMDHLGIKSPLQITIFQDGTKNTINISSTTTIDEFVEQLNLQGFNAEFSSGKLIINGIGDSYISNKKLENCFKILYVDKNFSLKKVNTNSEHQTYEKNILPQLGSVYAPGTVHLQIGINNNEHSKLNLQTAFKLISYDDFRQIGKNNINYLDQIDDLLKIINSQQTELGTMQNRLESVLEEVSIKRENLISSRSTLRDADIAIESSTFIAQQILQQASITLMSTANQNPNIALQLL